MLLSEYLESQQTIRRLAKDTVAVKKGLRGPHITYTSLFEQAKKLSLMFPRNSIISSSLANSIENIVVFLAVTMVATIAPLNPDYTEAELGFYLKQSPGGLIVSKGSNEAAIRAARKIGLSIFTVDIDHEGVVGMTVERGSEKPAAVPRGTALILYTSGTTGQPKLVPLSHSNMIASIENIVETYDLNENDTTYAIMPLFHVHGLMASVFATLGSGGRIVVPSTGKFSPSVFWQELNGNQCTWFTAVPTMHQILLEVNMPGDRHSLRFIRSCSSALAPAVLEKMEKKYGVDVVEAYAMTEACHQMTSNQIKGKMRRRPGTVGVSHGGVSMRILDTSGREVGRGCRGEICVKGTNVMRGYMNNELANKEGFVGEFFRTGDEGVMDKDGFITITGRIKELINRGGEKISPLEIDAVLLSHPAVSEAVSFGIPDSKYGEVVGAVVIPRKGTVVTESELLRFVAGKLASFKVPVKLFISDQLPRTATGKIQRRLVAKHFLENSRL